MSSHLSAAVLLAASAMHLGFQLTVSGVIYPALVGEPAGTFPAAHRAHSRRITPVVVVVYGLLAVGCGWALQTTPGGWTAAAVAAAAVAALATALGAVPTHRRLDDGLTVELTSRLLLVDRVRTVAAAAGAVAAFVAAR